MQERSSSREIAIIGMACRFPGASDIHHYWKNLCEGRKSITFFSRDELISHGVPAALVDDPDYVRAAAVLSDYDKFDAEFFGFPPRMAQLLDPQQRLLLEVAWEAFEDAGYPPQEYAGIIGSFTGSGGVVSSYLLDRVLKNPSLLENTGSLFHLGNDTDFLGARLSYAFNLRGPSINVQTACATSITALHLASQSILQGECDMALVGTSNIRVPHYQGYLSNKNSLYSTDGVCSPFDAKANGTVFGSGVASIILKEADKARQDRDHIYGYIRSSAINNDGSQKLSFTTTNVMGMTKAMIEAIFLANIDPADVSYLECHGTGTLVGDPLEIKALTQVFSSSGSQEACHIGSVKGNIGHLDHTAGLAGLIKVAMAMKHRLLPPQVNFEQLNPKMNVSGFPFKINTNLHPWETSGTRIAGVNSLGLGGANAFAIMSEAIDKKRVEVNMPLVFVLSAKKPEVLQALISKYIAFIDENHDISLLDLCYTVCVGRAHFSHRIAFIVDNMEALKSKLKKAKSNNDFSETEGDRELQSIKERYLSGESIDWGCLFKSHPAGRISLPTYPFEKKRYWLDSGAPA